MDKRRKTNKTTQYRKYNAKEGLWIPYFYIMYHYWWRFLKIAYEEKKIIRWKYYKGWGGKEMFDVSFRTWWKYHYKQLFAIKDPNSKEKIRFPMTTNGRDADALKITLEIHKLKRYKDSWYIYDRLCKKRLDKFFTVDKDPNKLVEIKEVNRNIKRYRDKCKRILDNVCVGKFP